MTSSGSEGLPPLFGLVLAGGRSRRMGRDKALLSYAGRPQLEVAFELLSAVCDQVRVSVRPDQVRDEARSKFPLLPDALGEIGPLGGILTALQAQPGCAWLVVACDLPFLDARTLQGLRQNRRRDRIATAYLSTHDGLPEPLCSIYEPAAREHLQHLLGQGIQCPRKALIRAGERVTLLPLPVQRALDNMNTPEDLAAAGAGG